MLVFIWPSPLAILFVPVKFQWIELKTTHTGTSPKCLIPIGADNCVQSLWFRKWWSTQRAANASAEPLSLQILWRFYFQNTGTLWCERGITVTETWVSNSVTAEYRDVLVIWVPQPEIPLEELTSNLSNQTLWHPLRPSMRHPHSIPLKKKRKKKQRERGEEREKRPCFTWGTPG